MGISVDYNLLTTAENWPLELVVASKEMADEIGTKPLRPPEARRLLKKHIEPLAPHLQFVHLIPGVYPTWEYFRIVGEHLEGTHSTYLDRCIGTLLIQLPSWAAHGQRTRRKPRIFCQLCWRHVVNDRKFCADHDPQISQSGYRLAYRLRKTFQDELQLSRLNDQRSSCLADWEHVINRKLQLATWLQQYRPLTSKLIAGHLNPTFSDLLQALDHPEAESKISSLMQRRKALHRELLRQPDQLYGLLRRAEAWLSAKASKPYGGKRPNAGRKPHSIKARTR